MEETERGRGTSAQAGLFVIFLIGGGELNLFGADERGHDAHVWRQEELQTHDEDGEDGEGQQLQTVIHQL